MLKNYVVINTRQSIRNSLVIIHCNYPSSQAYLIVPALKFKAQNRRLELGGVRNDFDAKLFLILTFQTFCHFGICMAHGANHIFGNNPFFVIVDKIVTVWGFLL